MLTFWFSSDSAYPDRRGTRWRPGWHPQQSRSLAAQGQQKGGLLQVGHQETQAGELRQWRCAGTDAAPVLRCSGGGPLSRPLGYAVQDTSSAHRIWACKLVSSLSAGTAPAFSSPGTDSPDGGYSPATAAGVTAPPCPGADFYGAFYGAYPGSASVLPPCVGSGDCGATGTGKPMTLVCRPSVSSRSRYMTGLCYPSSRPG